MIRFESFKRIGRCVTESLIPAAREARKCYGEYILTIYNQALSGLLANPCYLRNSSGRTFDNNPSVGEVWHGGCFSQWQGQLLQHGMGSSGSLHLPILDRLYVGPIELASDYAVGRPSPMLIKLKTDTSQLAYDEDHDKSYLCSLVHGRVTVEAVYLIEPEKMQEFRRVFFLNSKIRIRANALLHASEVFQKELTRNLRKTNAVEV